MSEGNPSPIPQSESPPQIDPTQLGFAMEQLRSQQNVVAALIAGAVAAAVSAAIWAGITVVSGYQIGWIALGVGFLVGYAVRTAGKGMDMVFGVIGGAFALLGCAAGNVLAVSQMVASSEGVELMEVLSQLDFAAIQELMVITFSPMDLVFYAIAIYEGYKLSFRQLSEADLNSVLPGHTPIG